ncbi:Uncharacterised protein [Escherichia coli]|nr:Uncharacterised protein [Escherichia coli]
MYLIEEALTSWLLNEYKKPVITKEEISLQIYLFYLKKNIMVRGYIKLERTKQDLMNLKKIY